MEISRDVNVKASISDFESTVVVIVDIDCYCLFQYPCKVALLFWEAVFLYDYRL